MKLNPCIQCIKADSCTTTCDARKHWNKVKYESFLSGHSDGRNKCLDEFDSNMLDDGTTMEDP